MLFPWEKLTGKPLIYASLGTLVNGLEDAYKHTLKALEPMEHVQVVLSVGKNINPENLCPIRSNTNCRPLCQPGTAARIAYHGVGEFIELDDLTTERLRGLIKKVLQDPSYRERAGYFQNVIAKARGLDVATDIIERAFRKYQIDIMA